MDEKKYKLICVRKGKTDYARTNNRKNVTLGSYTLVKRVARVYSKFALKLQAAPVFPGSVGLQQHKKISTLQCLGREQHISKII